MLVNTATLGNVEIVEENIFNLPDGLYGFDAKGDYALVTQEDEDVTLMWLQPVSSTVPCFVVFDPYEIIDGYDPVLEKADLSFLECNSTEELSFYVIAVVPDDIAGITVNLKSPIAVNRKNRRARQVILTNRDYPIRYSLFEQEVQR